MSALGAVPFVSGCLSNRPAGALGTPAVLRWSASLLREWNPPGSQSYYLASTLDQAANSIEEGLRTHAATRRELDAVLREAAGDALVAERSTSAIRELPTWLTTENDNA